MSAKRRNLRVERVIRQLRVTGVHDVIDPNDIYQGTAFLGDTVRRAHEDAKRWIADQQQSAALPDEPTTADEQEHPGEEPPDDG